MTWLRPCWSTQSENGLMCKSLALRAQRRKRVAESKAKQGDWWEGGISSDSKERRHSDNAQTLAPIRIPHLWTKLRYGDKEKYPKVAEASQTGSLPRTITKSRAIVHCAGAQTGLILPQFHPQFDYFSKQSKYATPTRNNWRTATTGSKGKRTACGKVHQKEHFVNYVIIC